MEKCAELLGVEPEALENALTIRSTVTGSVNAITFLTIEESKAARDSLAMTLYTMLFNHIITVINRKLDAEKNATNTHFENWIGIFDFCGYENFNILSMGDGSQFTNGMGFWQFMSNFVNDRYYFY